MSTHYITNDIVIEVEQGKLEFSVAIYDLNAQGEQPVATASGKDVYKAIGQAVVEHIDKSNPGRNTLAGEISILERFARVNA